ncbi:MAG: NTP transferase domain-containing protein [Acidobacteriota bacterium]|nr:NTP transferase domain-containing protein [Acidobacteriota bacterium]
MTLPALNRSEIAAAGVSAIILAAGYSSRMGAFKPLLPLETRTALECAVHLFLEAGVEDVVVVTGHRAGEIVAVAEAAGARRVHNANYATGMFSSVRAGVSALPASCKACFVMPVDMPLVRPSTLRRILRFRHGRETAVVYPSFDGQRGHPPLIARRVLDEVFIMPNDDRLSTLLAAHEAEACNLFVPDEAILLDMDTPVQYVDMQELAPRRYIPSVRECEALLSYYQPEKRVIQHCRAVGDAAFRLAIGAADGGAEVDPELARAGGLLHDLARGTKDHAESAASLLRYLEFLEVADIAAVHHDYPVDGCVLSEAAIVYLADKLIGGEKYIGLEQRFARTMERFRDNPAALEAASIRKKNAESIAHALEQCIGMRLHEFLLRDEPPEHCSLQNAQEHNS